jgi:hypothetical protein
MKSSILLNSLINTPKANHSRIYNCIATNNCSNSNNLNLNKKIINPFWNKKLFWLLRNRILFIILSNVITFNLIYLIKIQAIRLRIIHQLKIKTNKNKINIFFIQIGSIKIKRRFLITFRINRNLRMDLKPKEILDKILLN